MSEQEKEKESAIHRPFQKLKDTESKATTKSVDKPTTKSEPTKAQEKTGRRLVVNSTNHPVTLHGYGPKKEDIVFSPFERRPVDLNLLEGGASSMPKGLKVGPKLKLK